jgi:hypothetical protein
VLDGDECAVSAMMATWWFGEAPDQPTVFGQVTKANSSGTSTTTRTSYSSWSKGDSGWEPPPGTCDGL